MSKRQPGEPLARNYKTIVAEADAKAQTLSVADAAELLDNDDVQFVDIRDVRELDREGTIPGAIHAPRGMLEFWVDPESPYYRSELDNGKRLVLFCGGGWRSALSAASLTDMGVEDVAHMDGGFGAWKDAGQPTEPRQRRAKD